MCKLADVCGNLVLSNNVGFKTTPVKDVALAGVNLFIFSNKNGICAFSCALI